MHASAGEVSGQDTKEALSPSQLKARVASLRSRFHAEREEAVAVLGAPGTQAAELLEETAVSGYAPERACAIRALCAAAPERAARLLVEAVMHEIISVRVSAVRAARALGVDGAKALLAHLPEMPLEKHKAMRSLIAGASEEFVEKTELVHQQVTLWFFCCIAKAPQIKSISPEIYRGGLHGWNPITP